MTLSCLTVWLGAWSPAAALIPAECQIHTMWTAHLAHYSWQHLAANIAALWITGLATEILLGRGFVILMLLVGMPFISGTIIWLEPDMLEYRGFSGVATALMSSVGVWLFIHKPGYRLLVALCGTGFLVKLLLNAAGASSPLLPDGIYLAWSAHLGGAVTGMVITWTCLKLSGIKLETAVAD